MGAVSAIFAAVYFWWTKLTGCLYSEGLGRAHCGTFIIGVNLTFFPMHFLGLAGMPRRISNYPSAFESWNLISSGGSIFTLISLVFFFYMIKESLTSQASVWISEVNSLSTKNLVSMSAKSWYSLPEYRLSTLWVPISIWVPFRPKYSVLRVGLSGYTYLVHKIRNSRGLKINTFNIKAL
jgi:cytochrome c oxidase subunit 1